MARPKLKGLLYFPLDIDFFEDNSIRIVRARYKSDGVIIYLYLLTQIYREGYYITTDDDFWYIVSSELGIDLNKVKQVLNLRTMLIKLIYKILKKLIDNCDKFYLEETDPDVIEAKELLGRVEKAMKAKGDDANAHQ